MKTLLYILQKEFIQVFRNKGMLPIIFVLPIVQMMVLVFAATYDLKRVDIAIVDNDLSATSRQLVSKIQGNPFFKISGSSQNRGDANYALIDNSADLALIIPQNTGKKIGNNGAAPVQIIVNAINGNSAQLSTAYLSGIISAFNSNLMIEKGGKVPGVISGEGISARYWFNEDLNYRIYMAPGILVVLVTVIGLFLGGMNLVREKEIGTIEQINVTPIKKWQFLLGKLMPFLIIGLFDLGLGLTLARIAFGMPVTGSLLFLFSVAAIYLVVVLALGLLMSTISQTQQQVTFVAYFSMMIFVLMSGLFTPVESMPQWAQTVNYLNPLYYFVLIMRSVTLKGAGFVDLWPKIAALAGYAVLFMSLAINRYRKTV